MDILDWEEDLYSSTFDCTFDALIEQYKNGEITIPQLEMNIEEQFVILKNASTEGAARFQTISAMIDAHQFALSTIKNSLAK